MTEKASPALADSEAAGVIRALLDFRSVWTTHDLVALSRVPAPTIHRVVGCLEREDLVTRTAAAVVAVPDWIALLHRWSQDYRFTRESTLTKWQAVGGVEALADRIPATGLPYAVTGTFAAHHWTPTTPAATLTIYTPDPHAAAEAWNLTPASTGDAVLATPATGEVVLATPATGEVVLATPATGEVVLAAPSSDVVYTRPRKTPTGLRLAAPAQVLTDLLTGAAPAPTTADPLLTWMRTHELQWRY